MSRCRPRRVIAIVFLLASTLAMLAGPVSAAEASDQAPIAWGVAPANDSEPDGRAAFDYLLDPGTVLHDHVAIVNPGNQPLTLSIYAADADRAVEGGFDLLGHSEESTDVGAWVTLDTATVEVPARTRSIIPFRVTVPDNAEPGDHAGGIVAVLRTDAPQGSSGLDLEQRVGARIYLHVDGPISPSLEVEIVHVDYAASNVVLPWGGLYVVARVRNDGNVRMSGTSNLHVAGPLGIAGRSLDQPAELDELLPGQQTDVEFHLSGVRALGFLTATVTVEPKVVGAAAVPDDLDLPEGRDLVETPLPESRDSTGIWAPPWAVLAVVGLAASAWGLRRRRKNKQIASTRQPSTDVARSSDGIHTAAAPAQAVSPSGAAARGRPPRPDRAGPHRTRQPPPRRPTPSRTVPTRSS